MPGLSASPWAAVISWQEPAQEGLCTELVYEGLIDTYLLFYLPKAAV